MFSIPLQLKYIPRSGIHGKHSNSMFNFFEELPNYFPLFIPIGNVIVFHLSNPQISWKQGLSHIFYHTPAPSIARNAVCLSMGICEVNDWIKAQKNFFNLSLLLAKYSKYPLPVSFTFISPDSLPSKTIINKWHPPRF